MSIELHEECLHRLVEVLEEFLNKIKIENGRFIDFQSLTDIDRLDKVLPDATSNLLSTFISDRPFSNFVIGTIYRNLLDNHEYTLESNKKELKEIKDYSDLKNVANDLSNKFKTLPWQYHFTYAFRNFTLKDIIVNFPISDYLEIFVPDKNTKSQYPIHSDIKNRENKLFYSYKPGSGILSGLKGVGSNLISKSEDAGYWNDGSCYLRIKLNGFVSMYNTTKTVRRAIFILKAFIGFCLSYKLFIFDPYLKPSFSDIPEWIVIHKIDQDINEILETYKLPENTTYGTNNIYLNIDHQNVEKTKSINIVKAVMRRISLAFKHTDKSKQLLLASNWYFDSITNKNDLLAFVQAVVVLEILLGDKAKSDIIGLGELLRNRCAYLISKNLKERNEILSKFKEIYDVRSRIVHEGKNELESTEKESLSYLQGLCAKVIKAEVELLYEQN